MDGFTNYCTETQTIRAIELGAPILPTCYNDGYTLQILYNSTNSPIGKSYYDIPTAEQMCGWLRKEKHIKFMFENRDEYHTHYIVSYKQDVIGDDIDIDEHCIFAAIDAALDYLEKKGK